MMYCQNCGAESRPAFKFCPRCAGSQFGPQPVAAAGSPAAPVQATVTAAPAPQPTYSAAPAVGGLPPAATGAALVSGSIDVSAMQYAGFWRRFVAFAIDQVLAAVLIGFPLGFLLGVLGVGENMSPDSMNILALPFAWLYYALQESSRHQATWGKRALNLVVADMNGQRPSFGKASGRFWMRIPSFMILGIGFLIQPFTERRQTLHDKVSGAVILYRGQ